MFGQDGGGRPMVIRRNMDFAATILPHLGGLDANSPVLQMSMDMLNSLAGGPTPARPDARVATWSENGQAGGGGSSNTAQLAGWAASADAQVES